jgi:hypothetical protein
VPEGFQLAGVGTTDGMLTTSLEGESYARLVRGTATYTGLTGPIDIPVANGAELPTMGLTLYPAWYAKYSCPPASRRTRPSARADPANPSSWYPITAVPPGS